MATFDSIIEGEPSLRYQVDQAEFDLQQPCSIRSLLRRHPWLDEEVEAGFGVLRLFLGLRWRDAETEPTGQWICSGDLSECRAATIEALALDVEEVLSLPMALRLLRERGAPAPQPMDSLPAWLTYCGFTCEGGQISLPVPAAVEQGVSRGDLPGDVPELIERLAELLIEKQNPNVTLSDLILQADGFEGELGAVLFQLGGARLSSRGDWIIPAQALLGGHGSSIRPSSVDSQLVMDAGGGLTSMVAESNGHGAWLGPADRIATLLKDTPEGLSSSRIKQALGAAVSEAQVMRALFGDGRFAITPQGSWRLGQAPVGAASSQPAVGRTREPVEVGTSQGDDRLDKIESALLEADEPLTIEQLKERTGITLGQHYLKQQIGEDPRFSLCQKRMWALTVWGLPVYKPIKELVSDMVDRHGGAVPAAEVVEALCRDFGIKESSIRQCMSSPPFTARGGVVRRLQEDAVQEELAIPAARPPEVQSGRPDEAGPDVDELMNRLGLI
ncbi:hypothetical protein [Streptomyces bauhiniae]|uniref:hypothetical protein n=1 Tax=Streptomyces bauhiniae TaxID=2340725 RepID=UPI003813CC4E